MTPATATVAFVVGAVVCLATSWVLVSRLERIGERYGLSEAGLGLLAALAADTPEITAAVTALAHHQRSIGAGVIIGSNVFNLAALLGVGAMVAGQIALHRKVVALGGAVAAWVALVCLLTVVGVVGVDVGLGLGLVVVVPYGAVLVSRRVALARLPLPGRWTAWVGSAVDEEELELVVAIRPRRGRPVDVVVAALALVVVVLAAVAMERGASALGQHEAVAGIVIGGLVLAAVTSLPNAVAAVYLALKGRGAATLSTALNSNTINVVAGLLLPAVFLGLARTSGPTTLIAGWYVGLTALTLALAYSGRGLRRWAGLLIVVGYAAFAVAVLLSS
jgi:cation:H+ antiporter